MLSNNAKKEDDAVRAIQRVWQQKNKRLSVLLARVYLDASARMQGLGYADTLRVTQEVGEAVGACVRRLFCAYAPVDTPPLARTAARAVASAHMLATHHEALFESMRYLAPERCDLLRAAAVRLLACLDAICSALVARETPPAAETAVLSALSIAFLEAFKAWQRIDLQRLHRILLTTLRHLREIQAPLLHPQAQRPALEAQIALARRRMGELQGKHALEAYDDERWHERDFPGCPLPIDAISDARLCHELIVAPRFTTALCHNEAYRTRAYWDALVDDLRHPHDRGLSRLHAALALVRPALPPGCLPIDLEALLLSPREAMDVFRRVYVAMNSAAPPLQDAEREAWQALAARYRSLASSSSSSSFPASWLADGIEMFAHRAGTLRARAVMCRTRAIATVTPLPITTTTKTPLRPVLERLLAYNDNNAAEKNDPDIDRLRALRRDFDALATSVGSDTVVEALRLLAQTNTTRGPSAPMQRGTLIPRLKGLWQRMQRLEQAASKTKKT